MNASSWQSILLAKVPENTVLVTSEAVTCGDPEPAAMVYQECINHIVAEARRRLFAKNGEAHSIEASQPISGAKPEIPVRGLCYRPDFILRKSFVRCIESR
jgi:hypothetical protein